MEKTSHRLKKIFSKQVYNEELVSRILKELSNLNNNKNKQPN